MSVSIIGQEIGTALAQALGITHKLRAIEIRCAVNELVTVRCEILPDGFDGDKIKSVLQEYTLEPRNSALQPPPPPPPDSDRCVR